MSNPGMPQSMFAGAQQMSPQQLQMIMQMMQRARGAMPPPQQPQMPMGGMNPVNVPQQGMMPGQAPLAGAGPSQQMNPLASILGNAGGAMSPQGGMNSGTGNMGGLMQIINAMKAQQAVNGAQPQPGAQPGGINLAALLQALQSK